MRSQRYEEAIACYDRTLEIDPNNTYLFGASKASRYVFSSDTVKRLFVTTVPAIDPNSTVGTTRALSLERQGTRYSN